MPLDTSTYSLALLRLDGRRWNELRQISGQISTQASTGADGSSYLSLGNTQVLCTVSGPAEVRNRGGTAGGGGTADFDDEATVSVEISVAGFSGTERRKRGADRRATEMQSTLASAFQTHLFTHLYPRSTITIRIHILSQDGGVLATCINGATLALIDAGIPMPDYLVACTGGTTLSSATELRAGQESEAEDPLLDLTGQEELELPFLTAATVGVSESVSVLVCETRCRVERMEGMMAVAVDGCKQVRQILDVIVRTKGAREGQ